MTANIVRLAAEANKRDINALPDDFDYEKNPDKDHPLVANKPAKFPRP